MRQRDKNAISLTERVRERDKRYDRKERVRARRGTARDRTRRYDRRETERPDSDPVNALYLPFLFTVVKPRWTSVRTSLALIGSWLDERESPAVLSTFPPRQVHAVRKQAVEVLR